MIKRAVTGVKATFVILDAHRPCFPWLTHNGTPGSPASAAVFWCHWFIRFPFYCRVEAESNVPFSSAHICVHICASDSRGLSVTRCHISLTQASGLIWPLLLTLALIVQRSVCAALVSVCKALISLIIFPLYKDLFKKKSLLFHMVSRWMFFRTSSELWYRPVRRLWLAGINSITSENQKWVKESALLAIFLISESWLRGRKQNGSWCYWKSDWQTAIKLPHGWTHGFLKSPTSVFEWTWESHGHFLLLLLVLSQRGKS